MIEKKSKIFSKIDKSTKKSPHLINRNQMKGFLIMFSSRSRKNTFIPEKGGIKMAGINPFMRATNKMVRETAKAAPCAVVWAGAWWCIKNRDKIKKFFKDNF